MLAHPAARAGYRPRTLANSTTPPLSGTARSSRSRDVIAGHVYALPAVRELRRPLDAIFDPRTW
jgi:hypothetical protein